MLFRAVTNPDPACVQRATECLCHLWNVPNLCPHQKTNDLAATVQGFQSVNIQAEEIKTSLLGAQVAGKQIDLALNRENL
jgi:hypothetical protein